LTTSFAILFFIFVNVEPLIRETPDESQFCMGQSPEFACYNNSVDICKMVWRQHAAPCLIEIKGKRGQQRVTSLVGPGVRKCIQKKFDKALRSSRKLSGGEYCQTYFSKLDEMSIE
jgi:hypothetical protein